jgi:hypothetical protein
VRGIVAHDRYEDSVRSEVVGDAYILMAERKLFPCASYDRMARLQLNDPCAGACVHAQHTRGCIDSAADLPVANQLTTTHPRKKTVLSPWQGCFPPPASDVGLVLLHTSEVKDGDRISATKMIMITMSTLLHKDKNEDHMGVIRRDLFRYHFVCWSRTIPSATSKLLAYPRVIGFQIQRLEITRPKPPSIVLAVFLRAPP